MKRSPAPASATTARGEVRAAARRLARLVRGCEAQAAGLPAGRRLLWAARGAEAGTAGHGPGAAAALLLLLLMLLMLCLVLLHAQLPQEEAAAQPARYGLIETAKPEVASWLAAEQILREAAPAPARKVANVTR